MMTCEKLLNQYEQIRLVGRSDHTLELMRVSLAKFADYLGHKPKLSDFTDANLAGFAKARLAAGRSYATVQQNQLKLLALWRFACQSGLLSHWPRIKPLRVPERTPRAWTQEELSILFAAIAVVPGRVGEVPAALWWETLHRLLWNTGERVTSILGLRWQHVDLPARVVHVPAELRKGKTRDKSYRLGADTLGCLERLPHRKGIVLPWPWFRSSIYRKYRSILQSANLPSDRGSLFHRMRRSVASHVKAAGGDPTAAMDHASPRTTQDYLDPRICPQFSPADLLFTP